VDLTNHYFDLFRLPVAFAVDRRLLDERYLALQRQFHPDRYVSRSAQEQHLAVRSAAAVNQAYAVLCSPVKRAQYLLELQGLDSDDSNKTTSDREFLLEQMRLRESLLEVPDAADPFADLADLEREIALASDALEEEFASTYQAADLTGAKQTLVKMQFYGKLQAQLAALEEQLDEHN
tara:strand:+ start:4625 stop:5158 length:534 start_codon:yes stop_codon:yes gene_type:complete